MRPGILTFAALLLAGAAGGARAQSAPVDAPPALALRAAYEAARAGSPMLDALRARASALEAMEASAALPPDPQLRVGAMNLSLPSLSASMPGAMAPSIGLMQMLPVGKLGLSGAIARRSTAIARAEAEEGWWEVRSEVAMEIHDLYRVDGQLRLMRESVALLQDLGRVARSMYAAGEGRQADALRATVATARMEAEVRRMEAMRLGMVARLNALLSRPAATPVAAVSIEPPGVAVPAPDTLLAWAERARPLLDRGRVAAEQARLREGLARREIWPELTVGVQYGERPGEMGRERMGSLELGVTLPVFAAKRQLRMRREAEAMTRMAEADLAADRLRVQARVVELLADLDRARSLAALYRREILPQAEATVRSALSSYRAGASDFMTLLDAQMTHNQYRQELVALVAEEGVAVAELEAAIGRELAAATDNPTEAP